MRSTYVASASVAAITFVVLGVVALRLVATGAGDAKAESLTGAVPDVTVDEDSGGETRFAVDRDATSLQQAAALADGYVTWDEYESSVWAAFTCIKDAGFEPLSEPHLNAVGNNLIYSFRAGGPGGTSRVFIPCMEQNSMLVEQIWAGQIRPSVEVLEAAESAMRGCLVAGGYDAAEVESAPSFTDFQGRDDGGAFSTCVREVSIEHKVGWWAGD